MEDAGSHRPAVAINTIESGMSQFRKMVSRAPYYLKEKASSHLNLNGKGGDLVFYAVESTSLVRERIDQHGAGCTVNPDQVLMERSFKAKRDLRQIDRRKRIKGAA